MRTTTIPKETDISNGEKCQRCICLLSTTTCFFVMYSLKIWKREHVAQYRLFESRNKTSMLSKCLLDIFKYDGTKIM
jgi:hypothetical protein